MKRILITGGAGFIGHHFVEHILKNTDWEIVILDKLTYASSGFDRLRDVQCFDEQRVLILTTDFSHEIPEGIIQEIQDVDYVVHMGAETHVDRSISDPVPFIYSNVMGTVQMLELARKLKKMKKFIYFSTDEVFGPAPVGINYREGDRHNPGNPYAASKSSAESVCISYANTFNLPVIITNTMNVFGARQNVEKFIPMSIRRVYLGENITIHADKTLTMSGSRFYIHARNASAALLFILENVEEYLSSKDCCLGKFNIVGQKELTNLDVALKIAEIIGKQLFHTLVDFHSSRPGHDLRYALDGGKLERLGFRYPKTFMESFKENVLWTLLPENRKWINL